MVIHLNAHLQIIEGEKGRCQIYVNKKEIGPAFYITANNKSGFYTLTSCYGGTISEDFLEPIIKLINY